MRNPLDDDPKIFPQEEQLLTILEAAGVPQEVNDRCVEIVHAMGVEIERLQDVGSDTPLYAKYRNLVEAHVATVRQVGDADTRMLVVGHIRHFAGALWPTIEAINRELERLRAQHPSIIEGARDAAG